MAIKDLAIPEDFIQNLPTITSKKMAKISKRMVEIDRANNTAGKRNTQTTTQLMTLTMLTDSPPSPSCESAIVMISSIA